MSNVKISNAPVPFALPAAAAINGTETLPMDQTVGGVVTTVSSLFSALMGSISITYPTGLVSVGAGLTVAGGNFTSRGILDTATANVLTVAAAAVTILKSTTVTPTAATNGVIINAASSSSFAGLQVKAVDGSGGIILDAQSATTGAFMSFQNSGVERGFIGTGPVTLAGAALGDFTIGCDTGVMRIKTVATLGLQSSSGVMMNLTTAGSTIFGPPSGVALTVNGNGTSRGMQVAQAGAAFALAIAGSTSEQLYIDNTANGVGTAALRIDVSATTGTGTATFTAANKPTATAGGPVTWLPISINGTIRYFPGWA